MKRKSLQKKKDNRLISFSLLITGCLFLCNPNVNLFDFLPDAIGYYLLLHAIRFAAEALPHFDDAYEKFRILFWINLGKIPAVFAMLYITGIDMEERGLITVFALCFAVLEWIYALPAFRSLFEGFAYLGEREGASRALYADDQGKGIDQLTIFTLVFLLLKGSMSFLPETVFLSTFFANGSLDPGAVNPVVFYPFLAVFGFIVVLSVGLFWFFRTLSYFKAVKGDPEAAELLSRKYLSFADKISHMQQKKRQKLFFTLITLGFVFAIDPVISDIDILPSFLSAIAFFAVFHVKEDGKKGKIFALLYLASSLAYTVFASRFFSDFEYTDILYRDAALDRYLPLLAAGVLEGLFFVLTVFCLLSLLKKYIVAEAGQSLREGELFLKDQIHAELKRKCNFLGAFSILYAILRPVSSVLLMQTERTVITEDQANQFYSEGATIYFPRFAWLWILILVAGIALAVYASSLTESIKEETDFYADDT